MNLGLYAVRELLNNLSNPPHPKGSKLCNFAVGADR